jgi:FKBP-type peptidyl-prolyl cis-trans isomerase
MLYRTLNMKFVLSTALALGVCASLHAADPAPATKPATPSPTAAAAPATTGSSEFKTPEDKLSYSFGLQMGNGLRMNNIEVKQDLIIQGLKDGLGGQAKMTEQEIRDVQDTFRRDLMAKREKDRKEQGEKNKTQGEAFLAENEKKEGVKKTASGLQYKALKQGEGKTPASNDIVTVHYRGKLIDGTEFDSSYKNNQPATFGVGGVIKGWTEALQMMPVGSKWELYIPSQLAYGESGNARIQPNSVLIFEVELLDAKVPEPPKPITSDIIKVPSKAELDAGAKIEVIKPEELEKLQKQQQQQQQQKSGTKPASPTAPPQPK